jgi:hypothetical protein
MRTDEEIREEIERLIREERDILKFGSAPGAEVPLGMLMGRDRDARSIRERREILEWLVKKNGGPERKIRPIKKEFVRVARSRASEFTHFGWPVEKLNRDELIAAIVLSKENLERSRKEWEVREKILKFRSASFWRRLLGLR